MSLWYSKQDYEAYQDLNETADDALFAITILRNDGVDSSVYSEDELQEFLLEGAEILKKVRRSIDEPQHVERYHVAMANHLRKGGKDTPESFKQDLSEVIEALDTSAKGLGWASGLNEAENVLRSVEEFTARNSLKSIEEMGENFARVHR